MKIGRLEIKKKTFMRLLLCFTAAVVIGGIYQGIRLVQNLREFYAYQCLMTLPRHDINFELVQSAFVRKPEWLVQRDRYGWNVMHWNSVWCRQKVVNMMLKNGADVNIRTRRGLTPLHLATHLDYGEKSRKFIYFLIDNGADVNIQDDKGWTPLHEALVEGNKIGVEALVSKGADVNMKNNKGDSSLHVSIRCSSSDVIQLLLETEQIQINSRNNNGRTPLHFAALTGRKDVAEILLENGAKINIKDNSNLTPLQTASINGNNEMVTFLSNCGGV